MIIWRTQKYNKGYSLTLLTTLAHREHYRLAKILVVYDSKTWKKNRKSGYEIKEVMKTQREFTSNMN
jgi:hypothetical protein